MTEIRVACRAVPGGYSPLQILLPQETSQILAPYYFEFRNTQTGVVSRGIPYAPRPQTMGPAFFYFPALPPGTFDLTVSWLAGPAGAQVPAAGRGQFLFKGLTIPSTHSTGARGSGCGF